MGRAGIAVGALVPAAGERLGEPTLLPYDMDPGRPFRVRVATVDDSMLTRLCPHHEAGGPHLRLRPVASLAKGVLGIGEHAEAPPGDLHLDLAGFPGLPVSTAGALSGGLGGVS